MSDVSSFASISFRKSDSELNPTPKTALAVGPDSHVASELAAVLPTWHIERTESNLTALALVKARSFDLVVTGENTSAEADIELLRKIRRIRPHLRLVILAPDGTGPDVITSMREGAFCYLSAPYSTEKLQEVIRLASHGPSWDDGIEVVSGTSDWLQLFARCDRNTADRLLHFFHEIIDLPQPENERVAYAFREMLLNAIEHGGHFDPNHFVEISYHRARHAVICRLKDPGEGFSMEEVQHAAIANPPDDPLRHQQLRDATGLRPGGFGLLITRNLVDELIHNERGNEVLLIKYLDPSAEQPL